LCVVPAATPCAGPPSDILDDVTAAMHEYAGDPIAAHHNLW
jgi:hypothetical protein